MEKCLWSKTLLTVYRYLERISGAIDKIVLQSGLASFNVSGQNFFYNNVFSISKKIIDLSERKVTLINLKLLIEEVLKDMKKEDACLLIEKYFDGQKSKALTEKYGLSMRSLFRRLDEARCCFTRKLALKGFDSEKLFEMLKNEEWILNVRKRFESKSDDDFALSNVFLAKAVS